MVANVILIEANHLPYLVSNKHSESFTEESILFVVELP
jgi:hypothetical protein